MTGMPEVVQQEENAQADQQSCPNRGIHFDFAQAKPLGHRLAYQLRLGGLERVNHHVEVERRSSQAEQGVHGAVDTVAQGD